MHKYKLPDLDDQEVNILLSGLNQLPRGISDSLFLKIEGAINYQRLQASKKPVTPANEKQNT